MKKKYYIKKIFQSALGGIMLIIPAVPLYLLEAEDINIIDTFMNILLRIL